MVAVFAGGIAQVKFGVAVALEKFLHAVCVVVMRVAQDARVNCSEVNPHECGVFCELRGGSCVEQNALAVEFRIDAKTPFAF